ncbi:hypothetical protein [Streptomyces sp. HUAS TT20]|uniref:hypothetical protein n=1 Tax=Streptomyces sp. HUAS TT20 TaxID=3447509 RepID=UPI0021D8AE28|nr:hypothetical protein [Streptomyces sp. HUAS 15-9]UXY30912.1 hypothetical protein N8I87_33085 [Streptomyces sp. HUAS 15-9]
MDVDQLPRRVGEFVNYLDGLLARLDQRDGWCGVFWQRDPDGMQACLEGREVPPWDVVDALLRDLAAAHGTVAAGLEAERARALHTAALTAYDARPGGRDALGDRLDVMLRERRYAAERQAELGRLLASATSPEEADAIRFDLAWARDDHERATARCAELRSRMAESDRRAADGGPAPYGDAAPAPAPPPETVPTPAPTPTPPPETAPAPVPAPAKQRKRRRGSARFAGMAEDEAAPAVVPQTPVPVPSAPDATGGRTLRGARFAGAAEPADRRRPKAEPPDAEAGRAVAGAVATLERLRGEGRTGEAHALLVEIAHWPAARLPLLAAELQRTGLGADWATLLWEAASLPAGRLVAAADALVAAGRGGDGEQILRQGVVRPATEVGEAVLELADEGRTREVRALLDAYVRMRTPEEAARSVAPDPQRLVPLLLEAARGVSDERNWDLVHALRVAGHSA